MSRMYFRTFVNPLKLFEWEPDNGVSNLPENPASADLLRFLCPLDMPPDMSAFKKRYTEVSAMDQGVFLTLEEPTLKENLFGPLRQAKTNYVIGNYVGSIALCGVVAEKVALLIHEISSGNQAESSQFEKLGQKERVRSLKQRGLVDDKSVEDFGKIRGIRRSYLHHWNTPEERTAKLAIQAYASAIRLVLGVMNVEILNGHVRLNPKMRKFLERQGDIVIKEDGE